MTFEAVVMTLGYVLSRDRTEVLLVRRDSQGDGPVVGRHNGLGGKLEPDEDVAACMRRELREEAGIEVLAMSLRGTISWPGSGPAAAGRLGFVFLITDWAGDCFSENEEGPLAWLAVDDVVSGRLPTWEGRERWIGMVFDADPRPFHGIEPFVDGRLVPGKALFTRS